MLALRFNTVLKAFTVVILMFSLTACEREQLYQDQFYSFGTIIDVSFISNDPHTAKQALSLIQSELRRMHSSWHAWEESDLTRLNQQLQQQAWFTPNQELYQLVSLSRDYFELSDGLFDPAIGTLINAWGFHNNDFENQQKPALEKLLQLQQQQPSMADVEIKNSQLRGHKPSLQLDLGGIAKGYGLDIISQQLQQLGITNFILNAGGDIVASGQRSNRPWNIGVRGPLPQQIIATITTQDYESVFSSGNYERFYATEDGRAHHLIDPRNGQPASSLVASTVVHNNPSLADAAATALLIAGNERWRQTADNMGIRHALVIDQTGEIHLTQSMAERVILSERLISSDTTDKM